ncbi:MAG: 50S ribosomal protein L4 [Candidatus Nanopelagicales bacterium]
MAWCTARTPRTYTQKTPKKMKAAALRGALSDRARAGRVHVITGLIDGDTPSTKSALTALRAVTDAAAVLLVARALRRPDLEVAAQRHRGAPAVPGPAEHLRRARSTTTSCSPRPPWTQFLSGPRTGGSAKATATSGRGGSSGGRSGRGH